MKFALTILMALACTQAFADESCFNGYVCESAGNGQIILRQSQSERDESLMTCQVVTLANYGADFGGCLKNAKSLNSSVKRNYRCIADRLEAYDSDIFYNWSPDEIIDALSNAGTAGRDAVVSSTVACEAGN